VQAVLQEEGQHKQKGNREDAEAQIKTPQDQRIIL